MKHLIYTIIGISLVVSSCKTIDITVPDNNMPNTYFGAEDTTNIANVNWRQYFSDANLIKLIDTALAKNMDLKIALQRIEIARAHARFSKRELLPKFDFNISGGLDKFGLYTMDGAGNAGTEIADGKLIPSPLPDMHSGLQASWELDFFGKLRNQKKSAVNQFLASIEGVNFVVSNLIAEVAINYYELLALDNELEIMRKTIQKQQAILNAIKLQKEVGRANELAVQQFTAELLGFQFLEKELLQNIKEAEYRIHILLEEYPNQIHRTQSSFLNDTIAIFSSGIPSQLLQNRPDIREAELLLIASKFDLKAARAAFYPNLNITSGIGFQAFNPEYFFNPSSMAFSVLGNLTAPLINRNAIKAQFKSANANQLTALYNYFEAIHHAYFEVITELSRIENLKQLNILAKKQSEILNKSVETSNELYYSAKATYLEVLLAHKNLLQAQLQQIEVIKRQHISSVIIYKVLGGGW